VLGGSPWAIAAFYAMQGMASAFWPPARQRLLYGAVPREGRASANAAIGSVSGAMTIAGAALGGVLSAWSIPGAIIVAAVLQLGAVAPLLGMERPNPDSGQTAAPALGGQRWWTDLAEGITVLRQVPLARSVVAVGIAWGFIGGAYNVLVAAYVTGGLHGGGLMLGVFYVIDGAAVIVGSAIAARLALRRHLGVYAVAYVLQGTAWAAMFLSALPAAGAACLAVMRSASGVIIGLDTTILLADVPERFRGRVTSLHVTTYGAVSRISLAVSGGVLAVAGLRFVGIATGVCSALVGVAWWIWIGRRARAMYLAASAGDDRLPRGRVSKTAHARTTTSAEGSQ
jgi:hypothetical protein